MVLSKSICVFQELQDLVKVTEVFSSSGGGI